MEVVEAASERGAGNVIMSGVALNAISTVVTLLGEAEAALTTILVVDSDIVTMRMSLSVWDTRTRSAGRAVLTRRVEARKFPCER